jgi:hypothetical protein
VLPAIPIAMSRSTLGYATAALFMLALAVAISELRAETSSRLRAYTTTLTILAIACGLSIVAAVLVGAS